MDVTEINHQLSETLDDLKFGTWGTAKSRITRVKQALAGMSDVSGAQAADSLLSQALALMTGKQRKGYHPTANDVREKVSMAMDELSRA